MPGQNMITPETLLPLIGAPNAPVLIDVCIDEDFALDPRLIPGAFRQPFREIEALAPSLVGREAVVICQKGLKLSQGVAALLRAYDVQAKALTGGMVEWAALGNPALPATAMPKQRIIVAQAPSPDALAALWLIKRFVRQDAQTLFVAADAVKAVTDRFDGTPLASYGNLQTQLCLTQQPLNRISATIMGDTPEAAGLRATLAGLRALHTNDLSYMAATLPLFDALHRAFSDASDTPVQTGAAA